MMHFTNRKGFTLVETLVAITILTLAVVAPFQAIQNVVSASHIAKEKLVASTLAQEALEYVRFVRDNTYLADQAGYRAHVLDGMNGTGGPNCTGSNACTLDATVAVSSAFVACSGTCSPLQLNAASGFYTQANIGNPTIYTRSVNIVAHSGYETVTATVTWSDHGAQSMVLSEDLYDWL